MLLADKTIGHVLPPRFVAFSIVGALGTLVHMATLTLLLKALGVDFNLSQASAAVVAMTGNFFLNNALTYRDKRLTGRADARWAADLSMPRAESAPPRMSASLITSLFRTTPGGLQASPAF